MKLHLKKFHIMFEFKEILTAILVFFAVIDIVGNIPLIISLRGKVGHIESEKASMVAALIMIDFKLFTTNIGQLI